MEQEKTLVQENKMGVMNENKLLITMALPWAWAPAWASTLPCPNH